MEGTCRKQEDGKQVIVFTNHYYRQNPLQFQDEIFHFHPQRN